MVQADEMDIDPGFFLPLPPLSVIEGMACLSYRVKCILPVLRAFGPFSLFSELNNVQGKVKAAAAVAPPPSHHGTFTACAAAAAAAALHEEPTDRVSEPAAQPSPRLTFYVAALLQSWRVECMEG